MSGFTPVEQLKAQVRDEPYKTLLKCEPALANQPGDPGYIAVALEAIGYVLSDMDEHGAANGAMYGEKPRSFFEKRREELLAAQPKA